MESSDDFVDEHSEGALRCPICYRWGCPGSLEVCEHWLGMLEEDGGFMPRELLLELRTEVLEDALIDLGAMPTCAPEVVQALLLSFREDYRTFWVDLYGFSAEGWYTDEGMLAGSGLHLYHHDPAIFAAIQSDLDEVTAWIEQFHAGSLAAPHRHLLLGARLGKKARGLTWAGELHRVRSWRGLLIATLRCLQQHTPDHYGRIFTDEGLAAERGGCFARDDAGLRNPSPIPGGFVDGRQVSEVAAATTERLLNHFNIGPVTAYTC